MITRSRWTTVTLAALVLTAATWAASGADYYVNGSCSVNGNGTASTCATSAGAAGAWNDLQTGFSNITGGNTLNVMNGTYVSSYAPSGYWYQGGFHVDHSGTSSAPITIRPYSGHAPVIANCAVSKSTYCGNPTITAPFHDYVVFDGLTVVGSINVYGGPSTHNTVKNCDIREGWGGPGDGNWAGIFTQSQNFFYAYNNYIHDLVVVSGGGQQSSAACIKVYINSDSIFEYNTCKHVNIPESQSGGLDDKDQPQRNVHRYNWIEDVNTCWRLNNQNTSNDTSFYNNVCICNGGTNNNRAFHILTSSINPAVYNNTFYNCYEGMIDTGSQNGKIYNNIVAGRMRGVQSYAGQPTLSDYNAFGPSVTDWWYNSSHYNAITSYRSASGQDAHSLAATDCRFVNPPTDMHLQTGSPCRGVGRVGGTSTGAATDLGAYTASVTCVGRGCAGGSPPTSNQPPNGTITAPTAATTTINVGGSVSFSGSATDPENNTPFTYLWNFGSGSGIADSNAQNPGAKTFNNAGTFIVTFTATDATGLADTTPATTTVVVNDPNAPQPLAKTGWNVTYVDSQETAGENGSGANSIDSSTVTMWHTQWQAAQPPCPHEIRVDTGKTSDMKGFRYLPRQDGGTNGRIGQYEFYVSTDGVNWGTAVATGTFANDATEKEVRFAAKTGRYVRLRALTATNGGPYTSMAELTVLSSTSVNANPQNVQNAKRSDVR